MGKLKNKRMEIGLSQSQLAKKAGINVRVLQHYEQVPKKFDHARFDRILKIVNALGCSIDDVIEDPTFLDLYNTYLDQNSKEVVNG